MAAKVQSLLLLVLLLVLGTPATAKPLKIGVPADSPFPKYVQVTCNLTSNKCFKGFSIQLFRLILKRLSYKTPYVFIPHHGSHDSLIKQVYLKKFDAVVGALSIVAYRTRYVDFSRHYTEMGTRMVVSEKAEAGKAWIFVKPFTKTMWALTGAVFLYNGLMVWLIEKESNEELQRSSFWSQIGSLVWLTFTSLFSVHEKKLRSNLSRAIMVVWLFTALILTQSYTANLTSMLTVKRLRPSVLDLESLKKSSAMVGCDDGSFSVKYVEKVLGFNKSRIKTYSLGDDYAQDLKSGKIKAAFMELANIKLFLDKNNKGFVVTGPTFEIGGFGFAFSKGSPLVGMVSDEILKLRENGELHKLEEQLVSSSTNSSSSSETDSKECYSLSPDNFWGLFLVTGGTSTLAFLIFQVRRFHGRKRHHQDRWVPETERICICIAASAKGAPPHMFEGKVGHDPYGQHNHNAIQQHKLRRSNTF